MAEGSKIPDLNAVRGEIGAGIKTAVGSEVVSSVELLEHDSDPQAHGGTIESNRVALARAPQMTTHSEISSSDGGNTYTATTTWYPANVRMYTARVYCKAKAAGRNYYVTVQMPQGWTNMNAVVAGIFDFGSPDSHVKAKADNSASTILLELTRDPSAAAYAIGDTVIVTLLLIGTYS